MEKEAQKRKYSRLQNIGKSLGGDALLPMMKYNIHNREVMVREFKGINTGENYCSGELTESVNMSADLYPALCTRKERKLNAFKSRNITGIGNYEGIITTSYTDDGKIFFTVCGNVL